MVMVPEYPPLEHLMEHMRVLKDPVQDAAKAKALIITTAHRVKTELNSQHLETIKDLRIFPVVQIREGIRDIQFRSCREYDWFIADQSRLHIYFRDEVLLLDFSVEEIKVVDSLLGGLGVKDRFLSKQVKSAEPTIVYRDHDIDDARTNDLRKKAPYIIAYVVIH